jgi:two-component system OmpR family response regulator
MSQPLLPHVLVVDDDRQIRASLARFLGDNGLRVTQAAGGREMEAALQAGRFDVIVLDVMMPGMDGLTLCRRLREKAATPVIMLTAAATETDRVVGLEIGADDYVTKPFSPRELLARIRVQLRRAQAVPGTGRQVPNACFRFEGWTLDPARRTLVSPDGALVEVTSGEFDLLLAFVTHPRMVLTRDQLLDLAHGRAANVFDRSIDVQVSRLRRKIEVNPSDPLLIRTVRAGGYMFTPPVDTVDQDGGR